MSNIDNTPSPTADGPGTPQEDASSAASQSKPPAGKRGGRVKRVFKWLGVLLLLWIGGFVVKLCWPWELEVSPEITYFTEPLDKNGKPDLAAAWNSKASAGITPEDNAAVLLYQAIGPVVDGERIPAEFFSGLEMEPPPDDGVYLADVSEWLQSRISDLPPQEQVEALAGIDPMLETALERPWTSEEFPELAAFLTAMDEPLETVTRASRRPTFFVPVVRKYGLLDVTPGMVELRRVADALRHRANLRLGEGRPDEAVQDLLTGHRVARLVSYEPSVIGGLVAQALETITIDGNVIWLASEQPDNDTIDRYQAELAGLKERYRLRDRYNGFERLRAIDMVLFANYEAAVRKATSIRSGGEVVVRCITQAIDWNEVLRDVNSEFDRAAEVASIEDGATFAASFKQRESEIIDTTVKMRDPVGMLRMAIPWSSSPTKYLAYFLQGHVGPTAHGTYAGELRLRQQLDNLMVAFELARWHNTHGEYPEQLEELSSNSALPVPIDRFSGESLIYRRNIDGYLLYSVGVNRKDEGGAPRSESDRFTTNNDDQAIRLSHSNHHSSSQ